jgi:hypothetical protein
VNDIAFPGPDALIGVIEYVIDGDAIWGTPDTTPVCVPNIKPSGSLGLIENEIENGKHKHCLYAPTTGSPKTELVQDTEPNETLFTYVVPIPKLTVPAQIHVPPSSAHLNGFISFAGMLQLAEIGVATVPMVKDTELVEMTQLGRVGVIMILKENADPTPLTLIGVTTYVVVLGIELAVPDTKAVKESKTNPFERAGDIENNDAWDEQP